MPREPVLINLSETTLPRFLIEVALGRKPWLLGVQAAVPRSARLLERLARWAVQNDRARDIGDQFPDLHMVMIYPPTVLLYDIFCITEPWIERHYDFEALDRDVQDYAMACKQIVCQHTWLYHVSVLLLASRKKHAALSDIPAVGVPRDVLAMVDAYDGSASRITGHARWNWILNVGGLAATYIRAMAIVLSRTRLAASDPLDTWFVADHMEDERDIKLFRRLRVRGRIALIGRMGFPDRAKLSSLDDAFLATASIGRFTPVTALAGLGLVLRDTFRLFRSAGHLDPRLFLKMAALPLKRVTIRSLLTRLNPQYYWGRDPYNPDHIIRHQELQKIGARSFGMSDGTPVYCILFPHLRYVSFDRFYVYGAAIYEQYYRQKWSRDMALVPTASHSLSDQLLATRHDARPKDIVVFVAIFANHPAVVSIVRGLAVAFPDRTIYLQVKWVINTTPTGRAFVEQCVAGLANVRHTTESVYDLMLKAQYAFTDPSSVLFEAMQMGLNSFVFDTSSVQLSAVYRRYPDICIATATDAITRIVNLEGGEWQYPFEGLAQIVDLSGQSLVEAVCSDLDEEINIRPSDMYRYGYERPYVSAATDRI